MSKSKIAIPIAIFFTIKPQVKDDSDDSEKEVDPFEENPFADRPETFIDESVYIVLESPETL